MSKIAVVLLNLGGPDSKEAIKPFLFNFFIDANIIRLPYIFRWMVAKLISIRRSGKEAGQSYAFLANQSPLLKNTYEQADALETLLQTGDHSYKVFVSMRYWHPMSLETAKHVKDWNPDKIILLPLYPQYSTTTTRSSYQEWVKASHKLGIHCTVKLVCCYPTENGFTGASAKLLIETYQKAILETGQTPRVLFSAHGLPEDIIKDGDPYEWQCRQAAQEIVRVMNVNNLDWQICYQSRVGPKKWIGPSTTEALELAAKDGVPVVIYPHAFTQEHVETLVEIELEYRELAEHLGVPAFYRVPTVGSHPDFIRGLADIVIENEALGCISAQAGARICPTDFKECAMAALKTSCGGSCV